MGTGRGRGGGEGYPISFKCSQERKGRPGPHTCTATGRTRRPPSPGKGHPRKALLALQYRCTCGFVGWSAHIDLARAAVDQGIVDAADVLPELSWTKDAHTCKHCGGNLKMHGNRYSPEYRCTDEGGCGRVYVPSRKSFDGM